MTRTPRRPRLRLRSWEAKAVLATGFVVALTALPATRGLGLCAAPVGATVSVLVGMVRHRPRPRLFWLLVALMTACWSGNAVVTALTGRRTELAVQLVVLGQAVASFLVVSIFARWRTVAKARGRTHVAWGSTDRVLAALATGLVFAQVVATAAQQADGQRNWLLLVPALDVLLAGSLLRFLLSRAGLVPSSRLFVAAALVTIVYDLLVTRTGFRTQLIDDPVGIVFALAACLFAAAALHPSMRTAITPEGLHRQRPESARMLGLVPFAAVPAVLWLLGGVSSQTRLPTGAYLAVGVAVAVLGLLRGATAVASSERRAAQDPLTLLANRRGLAAAFDAAAVAPTDLLVSIIDLDDFKEVNDRFGHDTGDSLLVDVATRLRTAVPRGLVARAGGDEFVLLLRGTPDDVRVLVDAVFGEPFTVLGGPRRVHASVGVASVGPETPLASVLGDADIALYAVKAAGKGGLQVYRSELREQVLGRLALLADLRRLLDGDPEVGHLAVHYQPLVDLDSGELAGCEALVRWFHPEHGLVPPDAFLDLAEQHGLAVTIDRRVHEEALRQVAEWDALGFPALTVSVNLGRASMTDPGLATFVEEALARHGLSSDRLHLEITEHDELPTDAGCVALARLAAAGVRVSLDDFGVGWTSLDYLRRYPVSLLKLDRSLSTTIDDAGGSSLLAAVVQLARTLGIPVLAEGIETADQLAGLQALGITYGQGFHLARPLPAAELASRFLAIRSSIPAPRGTSAALLES